MNTNKYKDGYEEVLLESFLFAMDGEKNPTSRAIELQESRGQQDVVRNARLPRKTNDICVPDSYRWQGVTDEMTWEQRQEIIKQNNYRYTQIQYMSMGISIHEKESNDNLFYNVILPEGWSIKPTDHSMWNSVLDDKGRERISFFYKAAFYDRDAFSNFNQRYTIDIVPEDKYEDGSNDAYEKRKVGLWYGTIKDADKEIWRSEGVDYLSLGLKKYYTLNETLSKFMRYILKYNYPNCNDVNAYWND